MKKIVLLIFFVAIIAFVSISAVSFFNLAINKLTSPVPSIPPLPSEIPTQKPQVNEIKISDKIYQFYFHKITARETLSLIPNFQETTFSAKIMEKYQCTFGINGGFYKKEGGPLGLFFADQKIIGEKIPSTTFNGLLSKKDGKLSILPAAAVSSPDTSFDFILQSGPLIFLKNELQPNFLDRDFSRRHLIARDTNGDFYLFSIFEKNNKLNGPRLADLREIFSSPDFKTIADFDLILNLDGGSASAFYDRGVQVEEFKPIGSFLCGR